MEVLTLTIRKTNTANDAVLAEGKRVLINDPRRFDGVHLLGVDEHVWRHLHQ